MKPFVPKTNIKKNKIYVALVKDSLVDVKGHYVGYIHSYNNKIEAYSYWELGINYEILEKGRIDIGTFRDYESDILEYSQNYDDTYTLFEFDNLKKAKEFLKQTAILRELID